MGKIRILMVLELFCNLDIFILNYMWRVIIIFLVFWVFKIFFKKKKKSVKNNVGV